MIEQRLSAQIEAFTARQEVINVDLVETPKLFPGSSRALLQERVERFLPRSRVDLGRLGQHAVQIEKTGLNAWRQTK